VTLARLIVHDLEATLRARQPGSGLDHTSFRRLNPAALVEVSRLREEVRRLLRMPPESGPKPTPGARAQRLVEMVVDFVLQHYSRPFSLGDLALAMNMNVCYLSDLFSHTTGMTFHRFVEELRLAKARELLCDPRSQVCEVACAVGYASADRFRSVFKARIGIAPSAWRERSHTSGGEPPGPSAEMP
jgi:transcriptional regulator GlxA family with amidase domain